VEPYSPDRRTALLFCGTGAHGAYHAGVLRALQEAGVKIDVVAGQGIGAATAALAAIDGGARLWDPDGLWRGPRAGNLYPWKWPVRVAAWLLLPLVAALVSPALFVLLGVAVPPLVPAVATVLTAAILVVFAAYLLQEHYGTTARRRSVGSWWWRIVGAPIDAAPAREAITDTIWGLIRGAAPLNRPDRIALGRRYAEVLAESLGQPGFRELVIVAHDLETHADVVGALLRDGYRRDFMTHRPAPARAEGPGRERLADALDLAGIGRDHAIDLIAGALSVPLAVDPYLVTFGPDTYWRGETHRIADRPGAVAHLLQELYAAGVSQVILVSAVAVAPAPHRLVAPALDLHHRVGEFIASAEAAALRDAVEQARLRFDGLFLVCPAHNPVGPFDFAGAYDQASDRRQTLAELMERGYEDAYRQFIEPIVGASGEHLRIGDAHGQGVLDDTDSRR
jgi:hypothetical protein